MKYLIDTRHLLIGDIIMVRTHDKTCKLIRRMSNSDYSHAMIYVGGRIAWDSDALGVNSKNLQRLLYESPDDACAYRLKNLSEVMNLEKGLSAASTKIGMGYASGEEVKRSSREAPETAAEQNRQFCTRFVAQVYKESGLSITDNHDYCSTLNIEESHSLNSITNILRLASPAEIELALEKDNGTDKQIEATYTFLENIRLLTMKDLQTFDDVDEYLIANPSYDEDFNRIITETDFLEMGKIEKEKTIYLYNADLFLKYCGIQQCLEIAYEQQYLEKQREYNFVQASDKYRSLYQETGLTYFQSHICYQREAEYSRERSVVFQNILKYGRSLEDRSFLNN